MKKYGFVIFLIVQILFLQFLKFNAEFVETYYSNTIYKKISLYLRKLFGLVNFSIGDIFYAIVIIIFIIGFFHAIKKRKLFFLQIVNFISIFYFLFHVLWGYNYNRIPLSDKMEINTNYTDDDLLKFTEKMIQRTNTTHFLITKNQHLKVVVPYSTEQIFAQCSTGFENISAKFFYLKLDNQSTKKSLFSVPLSYMGFGGYLNPFTNEAHINVEMPKHTFAMTASHEMAHQLGLASESECNFIGYLAASSNKNLYVKYSAESFALRYCLKFIQLKNPNKFKSLLAKVNAGILANFDESDVFWSKHQSVVETGFKIFYDQFLKANQQKDGLQGYGKFLNLLIGFERK